MADIWDSRFTAEYRFMRVSRSTGLEKEAVRGVTSCSITRNQDVDVYETASLEWVAPFEVGNDFLRVYLDATSPSGASASVVLGTFMVSTPKRSLNGVNASGTADLYGRLKDAARDDFDGAYAIEAGTGYVEAARAILESCGLTVHVDDASDLVLGTQWTYGVKTSSESASNVSSKLGAANELLDAAGFNSAWTDAMGEVHLTRYVEPASRAVVKRYEEGKNARFMRDAVDEFDRFSVANVVHVDYSTQDLSVRGTAIDDDPSSPYSTVATGTRNVSSYSYSDVPDGMEEVDVQAMADEKAKDLLSSDRSVKHTLTFTHIWDGTNVRDGIYCKAPSWGVSHQYAVRKVVIDCEAGCPVECEARYYERI